MQLKDLFPDLVLYVPTCPEPTMERALREAARSFCRDTYVVTYTTDTVETVADNPTVELNDLADSGQEIIAVLKMFLDGVATYSLPRDWLGGRVPSYISTDPGTPVGAYSESENILTLWPTPDDVYELKFVLATAPTSTTTQIHDDLGNRWKEAVIGKAMATLAAQPSLPYTNPALVGVGIGMYNAGVGKARIELNRSFGRGARLLMNVHNWF